MQKVRNISQQKVRIKHSIHSLEKEEKKLVVKLKKNTNKQIIAIKTL